MSIIYNKYINKVDHVWYQSSNIVYSQCYDNPGSQKALKIVFKGGRTYLYKDVVDTDYVMFKMAESNGKQFITSIKEKYQAVRLPDADLEKLEELKQTFIDDNKVIEESLSKLVYEMEINDDTGEFRLKVNGKTVYEGIEGKVSIINLFNSMHITYGMSKMETPVKTEKDFVNEEIV